MIKPYLVGHNGLGVSTVFAQIGNVIVAKGVGKSERNPFADVII